MIDSVNYSSVKNIGYTQPQQRTNRDVRTNFCGTNTSQTVAAYQPVFGFRTHMNKEEKKQYKALLKVLDRPSRKQLESLLNRGTLLNSESQNNTSVLNNLYKIISTPRAEGLSKVNIAQSAINTLYNPYYSTQTFGDIPAEYNEKAVNQLINSSNITDRTEAQNALDVKTSGSCPAASIEFSMADKSPAEFSRFVESLTSPAVSVQKRISLNRLADNTLDAIWLLNAFEVPYEIKDFNTALLTLAPDKNALLRAQIQTKYQNAMERSAVDVMMQSTFMNVGSQQTYNSLNDRRAGKFSSEETGLIEFEKTFTESVTEDKNKITLTNQKLDENGILTGYEYDKNIFKKYLTDTLNSGENIIIGYTFTDNTNKVIGGHEITLVGTRQDNFGRTYFICNDSDDDYFGPVEYPEEYLLPKIHHATFPKHIVENNVKFDDNWVEGLNNFKQIYNNAQAA